MIFEETFKKFLPALVNSVCYKLRRMCSTLATGQLIPQIMINATNFLKCDICVTVLHLLCPPSRFVDASSFTFIVVKSRQMTTSATVLKCNQRCILSPMFRSLHPSLSDKKMKKNMKENCNFSNTLLRQDSLLASKSQLQGHIMRANKTMDADTDKSSTKKER